MKTYFKKENRYTKFDLISGELVDIFVNIPPVGPSGASGASVSIGATSAIEIPEFKLSTQLIDISQIVGLNQQLTSIMSSIQENEFTTVSKAIKEKVNNI